MPGPPLENWRPLQHPLGWYRVWHPPQWRAGEVHGEQTLQPADSDAVVALRAFWTRATDRSDERISVTPAFQTVRSVRTVAEVGVSHCVSCRTGEARLRSTRPWWRRLLRHGEWRSWHVWVLQHGPIVLVATLLHARDVDPELVTLCRMLLQSIEFAETPADPPDVFAARVLELARRRFPLLSCRLGEELQITIGESVLNLFNFYRSYVHAPDRFDDIILPALTTVVQVQEWGESQTRPPLARVRERIMPMLYPETVWQDKFARFVGAPWVGGLAVLYVVDEPHAYWYISEELLTDWQISPDDLHSLSLENLERYFDQHPMELDVAASESGTPALMMPHASDAYNAARFISGDFTAKLREAAGGDMAIGLPGRDLFVAVSVKSSEMIEHLRGRVREDFSSMDHPLTDRLLLLTADGVCEYCDPESL